MNQSLESDVSVGVGPDSETQDVAITLRTPEWSSCSLCSAQR